MFTPFKLVSLYATFEIIVKRFFKNVKYCKFKSARQKNESNFTTLMINL